MYVYKRDAKSSFPKWRKLDDLQQAGARSFDDIEYRSEILLPIYTDIYRSTDACSALYTWYRFKEEHTRLS